MLVSSGVGKHVVAVSHSVPWDFGYNVPLFSAEKKLRKVHGNTWEQEGALGTAASLGSIWGN